MNKLYFLMIVAGYLSLFTGCKNKPEENALRRTYYFERYFEDSTSPDDYLVMSVTDSLKKRFVKSYFIDSRSGRGDIITEKYKLMSGDTLLYSDRGTGGLFTRFRSEKCDTLKYGNEVVVNCYKGKKTITTPYQKDIAVYFIKKIREDGYGILEWEEYYDKNMILVKQELVRGTHSKPYYIQRVKNVPDYVRIALLSR